ncbi:MAG: nucleotidyl transferase AbiEii/AbiGii toxin family protein [Prevotella sp.]|jgi:predicted nucleotidyltransferase component of viral defense system|nr:nucleotidyl transferase AbiEii/AbiGii toxin family protein [Prevotella sp.]
MNIWQNYTEGEKTVMLQQVAEKEGINEQAVEKDWWVSAIMTALSKTEWGEFLQFKGGTSLSKGWGITRRFSEDVDLAVNRSAFGLEGNTTSQRKNIRKKTYHYIQETLLEELNKQLTEMGITGYNIEFVSGENSCNPITVIHIDYNSVLKSVHDYILPRVKIEFNSMSLVEPYEDKTIATLIHKFYPDVDAEIRCNFQTVVPNRTFLEKIFLLNEEFQKDKPRCTRMSRHLYDLEKLMDTEYGINALKDYGLYRTIINHRATFSNLPYVDYILNSVDV